MTQKVGISVAEAARAAGVSRRTIERLIRAGELRTVRIGRRRIVLASAVAELLERDRRTAAARSDEGAQR